MIRSVALQIILISCFFLYIDICFQNLLVFFQIHISGRSRAAIQWEILEESIQNGSFHSRLYYPNFVDGVFCKYSWSNYQKLLTVHFVFRWLYVKVWTCKCHVVGFNKYALFEKILLQIFQINYWTISYLIV